MHSIIFFVNSSKKKQCERGKLGSNLAVIVLHNTSSETRLRLLLYYCAFKNICKDNMHTQAQTE